MWALKAKRSSTTALWWTPTTFAWAAAPGAMLRSPGRWAIVARQRWYRSPLNDCCVGIWRTAGGTRVCGHFLVETATTICARCLRVKLLPEWNGTFPRAGCRLEWENERAAAADLCQTRR